MGAVKSDKGHQRAQVHSRGATWFMCQPPMLTPKYNRTQPSPYSRGLIWPTSQAATPPPQMHRCLKAGSLRGRGRGGVEEAVPRSGTQGKENGPRPEGGPGGQTVPCWAAARDAEVGAAPAPGGQRPPGQGEQDLRCLEGPRLLGRLPTGAPLGRRRSWGWCFGGLPSSLTAEAAGAQGPFQPRLQVPPRPAGLRRGPGETRG